MAAMAKVAARADNIPWYHDLKRGVEEPKESASEIIDRISSGINKMTGGSAHEPI